MSSIGARARSAGRRFASGAAQTGFAMAGGAVYYGIHALLTPTLYGNDANNIPKRCWMTPVGGVVVGHLVSMAPKIGSMGIGLVGGATAIGIEQIQMGISIRKNQANLPQQTSGVGALVEASEVRMVQQLPAGTGEVSDAGALWGSPNHIQSLVGEAAGLSL
jgi:hypothetical protein